MSSNFGGNCFCSSCQGKYAMKRREVSKMAATVPRQSQATGFAMNWRSPRHVAPTLALASLLAVAAPAPAPAPLPARALASVPAPSASIPVKNNGNNVIQIGSGPGTY
ncbi:MAG: hypothetical protein ABI409_13750, partial [Ramlibacter sp.]